MGITVKMRGDIASLCLSGLASVRIVTEVRTTLLDALTGGSPVVLDLTEVSRADAAFAQLVVSARLAYAAESVSLEVEDPRDVLSSAFSGN